MMHIKVVMSFFLQLYFKLKFHFYFFRNGVKREYVVLDIDNTLAKTWQTLKLNNGIISYLDIEPMYGTINEINKKYSRHPRLFISNRNPLVYFTTLNWLQKHDLFDKNNDLLILTTFPENKLYYIERLVRREVDVFYYDDLSFNHENGEVKFYNKVIAHIHSLNVNYFDYNYINSLNSNDFTNN